MDYQQCQNFSTHYMYLNSKFLHANIRENVSMGYIPLNSEMNFRKNFP